MQSADTGCTEQEVRTSRTPWDIRRTEWYHKGKWDNSYLSPHFLWVLYHGFQDLSIVNLHKELILKIVEIAY